GENYLGTVEDAYATGAVHGDGQNVGGLVGTNSGTISRAYAIGAVTGDSNVGGLVGFNDSLVSDSFWNTQTTGQGASAGGTGKTTAELMNAGTFTDVGWDFDDVWAIDEDASFPYFRWRYPDGVQAVSGSIDGAGAGEGVTLASDGA